LIEHLLAMADNYHTVNQLYIQAKDRAEQAEAERDEFRKDAERLKLLFQYWESDDVKKFCEIMAEIRSIDSARNK
jgi:hypothetical protein